MEGLDQTDKGRVNVIDSSAISGTGLREDLNWIYSIFTGAGEDVAGQGLISSSTVGSDVVL